MNDIDQKIQAALRRAHADDPLVGEPNLAEEVLQAFRGRQRWINTLLAVTSVVGFGAFVFAVLQFLRASEVMLQLRWAGAAFLLLVVISMGKIWFWMQMQSNRVLREVKRVELLLVAGRKES